MCVCEMLWQNAPIVREWVGLRPKRNMIRVEQELMKFPSGNLQVTFYESCKRMCDMICTV